MNTQNKLADALRAIVARLSGTFDAPELLAFGPLSTDAGADIDAIATAALAEHDVAAYAGPECGHSACRQHWIDTGSTVCVEEEDAAEHDAQPTNDLVALVEAGRKLRMHRAGVADAKAMFVAPVIAKEDAMAFVAALAKFDPPA